MFNYTKAELAEMASRQNFIRDTLEKVIRLSEILDYINSNSIMKKRLVLKGGTAINLTVFHLPRLSVDIDLDYCSEEKREEMMIQRKQISDELNVYMQTQGYTLSPQSKSRHSLDSFVFSYVNLGGMRDNIKIEINYSLRSHLFEPEDKPILADVIHTDNMITVLQPIELFAAKINALLSRSAARDLYDTYNMVRLELFPKEDFEVLRKSIVFYTAISQEEIPEKYDVNRIDRISIRKIRSDLLPVIQKGEFVDLEKIKSHVKDFLTELMVLTVEEEEFLKQFKNKKYIPELLFEDKRIIRRIEKPPMALWKMLEH
ncbi:nucleotidyl transferase AbiEii/AbiGii toxin family protein [Lachnoclostridium edouardi]|uniref:nucleotidyl transferase AbiEii/AbiGii toxin family protein n=1 Tax=Lachnoclostridium edouardi TaxID=1926283 RepID=UPI0015E0E0A4|nr:nucleotidyl transferase AbiEii/AbiGii toxin family protein [Lachnoclostridium edouardi]